MSRTIDLSKLFTGENELTKKLSSVVDTVQKASEQIENLQSVSNKGVKVKVDTKELTEAQKIIQEYGKGGRSKYFVSEEAMLKNLTQAYEQYGKAISDVQKRQSKNDVMRWAGAYRGAGYDTKKVNKEVFDLADQVYDSFNVKQASGKTTNQMHYYSPESMKKLFDAMRSEAEASGGKYDFSINEAHWAKNRRDTSIGKQSDIAKQTKRTVMNDIQQGVEDASKEKVEIPLDDILNVSIGKGKKDTIQKKVTALREELEKFYSKAYDKEGAYNQKADNTIDQYIRKYSEYAKYMGLMKQNVEQRYTDIYENIHKFSKTRTVVAPTKYKAGQDDFAQLKAQEMASAEGMVNDIWAKAERKAAAQLAVGVKPSAKAGEPGEDAGEKIAEGMKKAGEATQEAKEKIEQVGETGKNAGEKAASGMEKAAESAKETRQEIEQASEAAKSVAEAEKAVDTASAKKTAESHSDAAKSAEEHAGKVKEVTQSIQEEVTATQQLNAEKEKSSQQNIQDNTAQQAKENEEALHKQAEAQREVNDAKEQSNDKSKLSSASQEISQVEQMEAALDFQKKKLYDLKKQAEAVKQVYDDLQDRNEYIKARRNVKGTKDNPNPFGLDGNLDKLYEQAIDHINRKEPNMAKAAAYYGFYRNAGGKDRAVVNGEDFTRQLVERWNAIQKLNKAIREGSINTSDYGVDSLNAANEAIREQQIIVDNVTEKVRQTKKEAAEQRKAERELAAQEYEDSKAVWSQGLNEQEIAGVEAYLKKVKALKKEAYNETDALAKAMSLVEKIKKRDVSGLMDQFTKDTPENNALLGKITEMPVRSQKQRNAALRSINQEQYDQLIKGQTEAVVEQGMQGIADASKNAGTSGADAMGKIGDAAEKASSRVNETYEAVEKIMHLSWNGGSGHMALDLDKIFLNLEGIKEKKITATDIHDNFKRIVDTINIADDSSTIETNFKQLNDYIEDRKKQLSRWITKTDKDSGWDVIHNPFDSEVFKNLNGASINDSKKVLSALQIDSKNLFNYLSDNAGMRIPKELKAVKSDLADQVKNGALDAVSAYEQLLQKVRELHSEQNKPSSATNNRNFAADIKSLEGYSSANENFVNQLIASVTTGQKEYDAAMEELRSHIAQRQEEIRTEQEKNLRVNTEISKFASGSKPILDAMGIAENGPYPTQYSDFIAEIQSESIKGEEAVLKFAEAFGFVYDQVNQTWARPTSRKDDFLNATIEGYKEYIDTVAGGAEINSVQIAWDKMLDQKTFNDVLDTVNKINEAFRQGKLDSEGYIEGLGRLDGMDWAKYYARYLTKDDRFGHGARYLDEAPEGWKKLEGALTAPQGYEWYSNGASRFSNEYQAALVKVREETQTTKDTIVRSQEEIQAEIERTNSVIKIQEQWMDYLGDPNAPVTSTGKRDATDILRNVTKRLVNYRMHPEEFIGQMDEEKITVHWWKAMQEAQRQGVANSTISRYRTDISESDYEGALSKLQESLALHKDILQKSEDELVQLQAELQQAASEGAARNPSLSSPAADQHREQQQSAEDAATSEEHLKEAEEAAAQAGASSGEATQQHQEQAQSAESAASAEEHLKNSIEEVSKAEASSDEAAKAARRKEILEAGKTEQEIVEGLIQAYQNLEKQKANPVKRPGISDSEARKIIEANQESYVNEAKKYGVDLLAEIETRRQAEKQATEEAVAAEEKLKNATQDTVTAFTGTDATANVHKQQEESANAAADAEEKLKGATAESQQTGSQESGATHAHREQQKAAEDAADAEKQLWQTYVEATSGSSRARLISEKDVNDQIKTKTFEISKGLTATGVYARDSEGNWPDMPQQVSVLANYNTLLQDTVKHTRELEIANAALKLAYEKQSDKAVIDSIQAQINYHQELIDKNNELADSYARISGVENAKIKGLPYTKEQYDADVAEQTREIQLKVGKQSAEQIERQQARNEAALKKEQDEAARVNTYVTQQLEKLKNIRHQYDISQNPEAIRGIKSGDAQNKTGNIGEFIKFADDIVARLEAMRGDKRLDPSKMDDITAALGDLKRLGDEKYLEENAKKGDLSRQSVESMKKILLENIRTLQANIKTSKGDTTNIAQEAKTLEDSVSGLTKGEDITKKFAELRELKSALQAVNAEARVLNESQKAAANSFQENIEKINALARARSDYLDVQSALLNDKTPRMSEEDSIRNVIDAKTEAEKAMAELQDMLDAHQITQKQYDEALKMYQSEESQLGSIQSRAKYYQALDNVIDELANSYIKLADAEEKAEHSKSEFGRQQGKNEVNQIKQRQEVLKARLQEYNLLEDNERIAEGQRLGTLKATEYEEKRNAVVNTKGLGFEQGDNIERTWDVLIQKASQYQQLLFKQDSGQTLTVNEELTLQRLAPLYDAAAKQATTASEKYTELQEKVSGAKDVIYNQAINQYDKIIGGLEAPGENMPQAYNDQVQQLRANLETIRNMDIENPEWFDALNRLKQGINDLKADKFAMPVDEAAKTSLNRRIADWINKNSAGGEYLSQMQDLQAQLSSINSQGDLEQIAQGFESVRASAAEAGKTGLSFGDGLIKRFKSLGQYLLSFASFYRIIGTLKQAVNIVKELDTGLMEVRKVAKETDTVLKKWQKSTFNQADMVGGTANQIEKSTAAWLRLGKSFEESMEAAQASVKLLNVSEFTNIDDATTSLVSMRQAFEGLSYEDFIDKLNGVGDNFSSSTDQLAQGMQNVSAVLKTAGNDIDQSLALLTAANNITQDMSKASMGVRTVALRIAGTKEAKEELEEYGEDTSDFVVQTASKVDAQVRAYTRTSKTPNGVSVLDDNGRLRDTFDILLDIAKVYDDIVKKDNEFGTNTSNALLELLAGKTRSNILASILQAPDILEQAYETSKNSQGVGQRELDVYLDSIEARIQKLQNRLQELAFTAFDSESIKAVVDGFTQLVSLATKLVDTLGVLPTLLGVFGGLMAQKSGYGMLNTSFMVGRNAHGNGTGWGSLISNMFSGTPDTKVIRKEVIKPMSSALQQAMNTMGVDSLDSENMVASIAMSNNKYLKSWISGLDDSEEVKNVLRNALNDEDMSLKDLHNQITLVNTGFEDTQVAVSGASKAISLFGKGVGILKGVGSTLLTMGATMLASFAIQEVVKGIYNWVHANEIAIKKGKEAKDVIDSTYDTYAKSGETIRSLNESLNDLQDEQGKNKKLQSTGDALDNIAEKYTELHKGVNEFTNENVSLSNEDYEQYLQTCSQLAEQFPSLVKGYDDQNNAILSLGDSADTAKGKLTELYAAQQLSANVEIAKQLQPVYDGLIAQEEELTTKNNQLSGMNENLSTVTHNATFEGNVISVDPSDAQSIIDIMSQMYNLGITDQWIDEQSGQMKLYFSGITDLAENEISDLEDIFNNMGKTSEGNAIALNEHAIRANEMMIEDQWSSMTDVIGKYLQTSTHFTQLSEDVQSAILGNIGKLDRSKIKEYGGQVLPFLYSEYIEPLNDLSEQAQDKLANAFTLDPEKMTIGEYSTKVRGILLNAFDGDKSLVNEWWKRLGFENTVNDLLEKQQSVFDSLGGKFSLTPEQRLLIFGLDAGQLDVAKEAALDESVDTFEDFWNQFKKLIDNSKKDIPKDGILSDIFNDELYKESAETSKSNLSTLSSSLETLRTEGSLTAEQMRDLQESFPDLTEFTDDAIKAKMFEELDKQIMSIREKMDGMTPKGIKQAQTYIQNLIDSYGDLGLEMSDIKDTYFDTRGIDINTTAGYEQAKVLTPMFDAQVDELRSRLEAEGKELDAHVLYTIVASDQFSNDADELYNNYNNASLEWNIKLSNEEAEAEINRLTSERGLRDAQKAYEESLGKVVGRDYYEADSEISRGLIEQYQQEIQNAAHEYEKSSKDSQATRTYQNAVSSLRQQIYGEMAHISENDSSIIEAGAAPWEYQLDRIKNEIDSVQQDIDDLNNKGQEVTAEQYQSLIDKTEKQIRLNQGLADYYTEQSNEAYSKGNYEDAAKWASKANEYSSVVVQLNGDIIELRNNMNSIDNTHLSNVFTQLQNEAENLEHSLTDKTDGEKAVIYVDLQINAEAQKKNLEAQRQAIIDDFNKKQEENGVEYSFNDPEYQTYLENLRGIDDQLRSLADSQREWANALLNTPIDAINKKIDEYDAKLQEIQDRIKVREAKGGRKTAEDYDSETELYNQEGITNTVKQGLLNAKAGILEFAGFSDLADEAKKEAQQAGSDAASSFAEGYTSQREKAKLPLTEYDDELTALQQRANAVQRDITAAQEAGADVDASQFDLLISNADQQIAVQESIISYASEQLKGLDPTENIEDYLEFTAAIEAAQDAIAQLESGQRDNQKSRIESIYGTPKLERELSNIQDNAHDLQNEITNAEAEYGVASDEQYNQLADLYEQEAGKQSALSRIYDVIANWYDMQGDSTTAQEYRDKANTAADNATQKEADALEERLIPYRNEYNELQHESEQIQRDITKAEQQHQKVSKKTYQDLISNGKAQIRNMKQQQEAIGAVNEDWWTLQNSIDSMNDSIYDWSSTIDSLVFDQASQLASTITTAIQESVSETGLSTETINALLAGFSDLTGKDLDVSDAFYNTADGVKVNTEALRELTQAEFDLQSASIISEIEATQAALNQNPGNSALQQKLERLMQTQAQYFAQYEEMQKALSYNNAIDLAEGTSNAGANYDKNYGRVKTYKEAREKGLIGTDDFKAWTSYLDVYGRDTIEAYDAISSKIDRYFTEDASQGLGNFLTDMEKLGYAAQDADGYWTITADDYDAAAKDMQMGSEWFMDTLRKLEDFGMVHTYVSSLTEAQLKTQDAEEQIAEAMQTYGEMVKRGASEEELQKQIDHIHELEQAWSDVNTVRETWGETSEANKKKEFMGIEDQLAAAEKMYAEATTDAGRKQAKEFAESVVEGWEYGLDQEAGDGIFRLDEKSAEDYASRIKKVIGSIENPLSAEEMGISDENVQKYEDSIKTVQERLQNGDLSSLQETLSGLTAEDLNNIDYSDGKYTEGFENAEAAVDSLRDSLGLAKEDTGLLIDVMTALGLVEGTTVESLPSKYEELEQFVASTSKGSGAGYQISADLSDQSLSELNTQMTELNQLEIDAQLDPNSEVYQQLQQLKDDTQLEIDARIQQNITDSGASTTQLKAWAQAGDRESIAKTVGVDVDSSELDQYIQQINSMPDSFDMSVHIDDEQFTQLVSAITDPWSMLITADTSEAEQQTEEFKQKTEKKPIIQTIQQKIQSFGNAVAGLFGGGQKAEATASMDTSGVQKGAKQAEKATKDVSKAKGTATADINITPAMSKINQLRTALLSLSAIRPMPIVDQSSIGNAISRVQTLINKLNEAASKKNGLALGTAHILGTAHSLGTTSLSRAYASGSQDWAVGRDESALVNEIGQESRVRDGVWELIPGGPHVEDLKKDDIIFNAEQTADLIRTGKTARSGKLVAHANGTVPGMSAYVTSGRTNGFKVNKGKSSSKGKSGRGNGGGNSGNGGKGGKNKKNNKNKALDNFNKYIEKLFDWIEVRLDRIQRRIDNATQQAENAIGTLNKIGSISQNKNAYINTAMNETRSLISNNQAGEQRYYQQANKVYAAATSGKTKLLSADKAQKIIQRIKDGTIDINEYNEKERKFIDAYKEWWIHATVFGDEYKN